MIEALKFFMSRSGNFNYVSEAHLRRLCFDRTDIDHLVQLGLLHCHKDITRGMVYRFVRLDGRRKLTTNYNYSRNRENRRLAHLRRKNDRERLKAA